jgi:APOBEC-like N-terminal domain
MQTYNSNDDPMSTDNGTHAETQFVSFMRNNDDLRARTREVKIRINKSPCPRCAEMLTTMVSLFPPGTRFSLSYSTVYSNEVITEEQTLAGLAGMSSWSLSGPKAPKKAEKQLVGSRS